MRTSRTRRPTVAERLSLLQLQDLRSDVVHVDRGGKLIFAVDSYDILRYCFPNAGRYSAHDTDELSDYHAAMSLLLNNEDYRVVLLPEYLQEVSTFMNVARASSPDLARSDSVEFAKMAEEILGTLQVSTPGESDKEKVSFVARSFSQIFLVASIARRRIGFAELARLSRDRLAFLSQPTRIAQKDDVLAGLLERFNAQFAQREAFVSRAVTLLQEISERSDSDETREIDSRRRNRSDVFDARALDRVWQLNDFLDRNSLGEPTPYGARLLSSSARIRTLSERLLHEPNDRRYEQLTPVIRLPDQIFAYVTTKGEETTLQSASGLDEVQVSSTRESLLKSLQWLIELGDALQGRASIQRCEECPLVHDEISSRAESSCSLRLVCRHYAVIAREQRQVLIPFQNQSENLALFGYVREHVIAALSGNGGTDSSLSKFLVRVSDLFGSRALADLGQTELAIRRSMVHARAALLHQWYLSIDSIQRDENYSLQPEEQLRGGYHALPWLLRFQRPELLDARRAIFSAVLGEADSWKIRGRLLIEAYSRASSSETRNDLGDEGDDANLFSVLMLLAMTDQDSTEAGRDLAMVLASRFEPGPRLSDAVYALSWALRRTKRPEEAIRWSEIGVQLDESDPRFYHGRALARWDMEKESAVTANGSLSTEAIILDLRRALKGYEDWRDDEADLVRYQAAACLNGISFVRTVGSRTGRSGLKEAREALNSLKTLFAKENKSWDPYFPDFYHTEATLEIEESRGIAEITLRRAKLEHALSAARRASDLAPTRENYRTELSRIEGMLTSLPKA
jgi:hypothetical protein